MKADDLFLSARVARAPEAARERVWRRVSSFDGTPVGGESLDEPLRGEPASAPSAPPRSAFLSKTSHGVTTSGVSAATVTSTVAVALTALLVGGWLGQVALSTVESRARVHSESARPAIGVQSGESATAEGEGKQLARSSSSAGTTATAVVSAPQKESLASPYESEAHPTPIVRPTKGGRGAVRDARDDLAREAELVLEARAALRRGDREGAKKALGTIRSSIEVPQLLPEELELERKAARAP